MALDFIGGAAGGAAEGLEQVLRRVFLEAQQRQQAELAREQQQVQMRGQDITARGQDIMSAGHDAAQQRWLTDRTDRQTQEMAEGAEAAAGRAQRRETMARLLAANPPMARLFDARSLGLNINDPHAVETADEHAPHQAAEDARKVAQVGAEADARNRSEARFRAPQQSGLSETALTNVALRLGDDYARDTKDFGTVNSALGRILASSQDPSGAGDLALLFNYMKMLDPNSVVRESEFAQAARTGSLPQQIQAEAARLVSGQRLTPEQRADFVKRAQALYGEADRQNKSVRETYSQRAKKFGVDPSLILTDFGQPGGAPSGKVVTAAQLEAIAKKRGSTVEQERKRAESEGFVVR